MEAPSLDLATRGFVLGFSIAAVVGPIGLLCVRRTLQAGFVSGFVSGLGAATADASYAAIAGFGVTAVAAMLVDLRLWLRLIGGVFLVLLGLQTLRARPGGSTVSLAASTSGRRLAADYGSTLALTLSNPLTILSFAAIFAGLGLGGLEASSVGAAVALVLGVFGGSATWWLVLAGVMARLRTSITPRWVRGVNVLSGSLILVFGVQSLAAAAGG
jgi:threonine/homoserine/homoserine lactone efflux protein